ncbi:MAG TPA: hypothetical protein PKV82_13955 [Anaerolineae bacterium]|nr:hypothetical protein [Anaerolineae bacterium]
MSAANLRISGLVKAAKWAREQLAMGIPPQEAEGFRQRVRGTLEQVETICREHHIRPQDLPAPSYHAYGFLKEISLETLPLPSTTGKPERPPTLHITRIVAVQKAMNAAFLEWAANPQRRNEILNADHPDVTKFALMLLEHLHSIEALAQEQGAGPEDLPSRSRRAYQWLKFLSNPATLAAHLETLRAVWHEFHQPRCPAGLTSRAIPPVQIEFTYGAHLYRAAQSQTGLQITLHEGLLGAPPEVLRAVVCTLYQKGSEEYRRLIHEYSASDDFLEVVAALELTTAAAKDFPHGRAHDLEQVFERVNATYFGGQLARPKLMWNNVFTHSRLGYYDGYRDAVTISISLDAPDVPAYVLDYVMYHELLHKQLGVTFANGRHNAHTPEFRAAERRFAHYEEARAFIYTHRRP